MTVEQLFVWTVADLDERLELGRGEYDALGIAWLLRKLILDGKYRSLVSHLGAENELEFDVREDISPPGVAGWLWIRPTGDGRPVTRADLAAFLDRPVLSLWPENDRERECRLSVRQTIGFLANKWGAVHWEEPRDDWKAWQRALAEYSVIESFSVQTARGEYTGGVFCLTEIAQVARAGLDPLVRRVGAAL